MPKKKTKNQKYWKKRALELEAIKNKKVELQLSELEAINSEIARRMKKQIGYWVSRFAKDNGLSFAAAKQKLSPEEIEEFRLDLQTYIKYASRLDDQVPEEWLLTVRNASTTYHLTRLEALKIALINEVNDFIYKENNAIFEFLEGLYNDTYYRQTYEIAKGIDATVDLFTPNEYKVKLLVKKPWTDDGVEFSERLWGAHREKLVEELHKALEESLRKGDNATKMAEDIAEKFETRKDHAEALLHTESARIDEEARYENLKDLGVEKYIIVATLDHKTSSICRKMDGKIFELSKKEVGVNYPPFHVRCRTTVAPYIAEEYGLGQRVARDKNGKTIYVPENMTYPEFHKKYIEGDKEYSAVEKAWKNRFSDKKQYENYKKTLGKEAPKTFEDFQHMKYNDNKEWSTMKGYKKCVDNDEISPLIGYNNFKKYHEELEDKLIGMKLPDGTEIKDVSHHFTGRAIGTHDWTNPNNSKDIMKKLNHKHVPTEDIIECIEKGEIVKVSKNSNLYEVRGGCGVTCNPETGKLIQCNTRRK